METSFELWQAIVVIIAAILSAAGVGNGGARLVVRSQAAKRKIETDAANERLNEQADLIALLQTKAEDDSKEVAKFKKELAQLKLDFANAQQRVEEQSSSIGVYEKAIETGEKRLNEAQNTVALERTRADMAEKSASGLQAEIVVLDRREDKSQSKIIDISAELKGRTIECALKDDEIKRQARRIRELENQPPPPTTEPDIAPGAHDGDEQEMNA